MQLAGGTPALPGALAQTISTKKLELKLRPSVVNVVELLKMSSLRLIAVFVFVANLAVAADPPIFGEARPMPEMNALFAQTDNWIGGDGVYSVALTPERTLWLFSDTWIGSVHDGRRTNATIVNNTLAFQEGHGTNATLQFIIRQDAEGKPTAFLVPEDKQGWFWLMSSACVDQRLYLFLTQIEKTGTGGAFGFRQIGQWLGVVTNSLAPPLQWQVEQHKLPCTEISAERHVSYGGASLVDGEYLYIYGTDVDMKAGRRERCLTVARARTNEVADFSTWRYFANGQWDSDYHKASRLTDRMATEFSVSFLPKLGQYLLIYTDRGLSPKIQARTAATPWGIWSAPTTVFQCPEMAKDKNIFCYAAKAHPEQEAEDAIIVSYVANSRDFGQVIADASLYWPRFIQIPYGGENISPVRKTIRSRDAHGMGIQNVP